MSRRGHALQRLIWDSEVPGDYLDVHVEDGWVTLKGDVDFQFQSDAAFDDVAHLHGVTGVTQVHELHSLDHATLVHVEAGDDPAQEHQPSPPSSAWPSRTPKRRS